MAERCCERLNVADGAIHRPIERSLEGECREYPWIRWVRALAGAIPLDVSQPREDAVALLSNMRAQALLPRACVVHPLAL